MVTYPVIAARWIIQAVQVIIVNHVAVVVKQVVTANPVPRAVCMSCRIVARRIIARPIIP